jgi:hypothetical protein
MNIYIKLPKGVIDNINRARKQCLWRGNDPEKKGGNLVAWPVVQQPKAKGGLGVLNLRLQNDALLLKQLSKFYNQVDMPWVQIIWFRYYTNKVPHAARETECFWWKDILRLNHIFRTITSCQLGNGSTVCFLDDLWMNSIISNTYPRLASFAKNEDASVVEIIQAEDVDSIFFLPLSQQALHELEDLQAQLQIMSYDEDAKDCWTPVWGNRYTSSKFYSHVFNNIDSHPIFKAVWKSRYTPVSNFLLGSFWWTGSNTKSMLQRRHLNVQDDTLCIMCNSGEKETIDHLFFRCSFARNCWATIQNQWDDSLQLNDRLVHARAVNNLPFFTEAALIATWELWKLRNDKVFQRRNPSLSLWLSNFKS